METKSDLSMKADPKVVWADVDEEDFLPPMEIIGPDEKGNKTIIEHIKENGKVIRITRKVKLVNKTKRVLRRVAERTRWEPFGRAASRPEEAQTILSKDEIRIEDPKMEGQNAKREHEDMLIRIQKKFADTHVKRELEAKGLGSSSLDDAPALSSRGKGGHYNPELAALVATEKSHGTDPNKYVPPSMREGGGGGGGGSSASRFSDRDDTNTLRVTNISEDTQERDLQDLFRKFGQVGRVYLARDRDTQASRGFAYVTYIHREDAEAALQHLNGYGYDHLILKLEWAEKQEGDKGGGGAPGGDAMRYASGYGKSLPQG